MKSGKEVELDFPRRGVVKIYINPTNSSKTPCSQTPHKRFAAHRMGPQITSSPYPKDMYRGNQSGNIAALGRRYTRDAGRKEGWANVSARARDQWISLFPAKCGDGGVWVVTSGSPCHFNCRSDFTLDLAREFRVLVW